MPRFSKRKKNPAAVALGKLGGAKGGKNRAAKLTREERKAIASKGGTARAAKLTPKERSELARRAVLARWSKEAR